MSNWIRCTTIHGGETLLRPEHVVRVETVKENPPSMRVYRRIFIAEPGNDTTQILRSLIEVSDTIDVLQAQLVAASDVG